MEVYRASAWRQISSAEAFVGGAWRTLSYGESYIGGAWRRVATFVQPLTLSLSPTFVLGRGLGGGTGGRYISTIAISALPGGGLGPYTYVWTIAPGSGGAAAGSPSSASSSLGALLFPGDSIASYATCTATDSLGSTAAAVGNFELYYS